MLKLVVLALILTGCATAPRCGAGYVHHYWTGLCLSPGETVTWRWIPYDAAPIGPGSAPWAPVYVKPGY